MLQKNASPKMPGFYSGAAGRSRPHRRAQRAPWKLSSTYLNARTIAADRSDRELARKLGELFRDPQP
jgi:hypothetical protein